ncbi:hypothetical protein NQ317_003856 [Molorchus minor]|uniref:Uncharacterized protein n=1 Tax=Molorchus minor TaxID=1323400 RepID=A0ABQ9JCA9_9CUCU|nr:hypothetical protein NQ317_003856 [Molorchus minor]
MTYQYTKWIENFISEFHVCLLRHVGFVYCAILGTLKIPTPTTHDKGAILNMIQSLISCFWFQVKMNLLWLFAVTSLYSPLASPHEIQEEKCLDIEEVTPKRYFYYNKKSLPIILEASDRRTHQLATHIFYIFIREVLGYAKVKMNVQVDNFNIESIIKRLSEYSDQNVDVIGEG